MIALSAGKILCQRPSTCTTQSSRVLVGGQVNQHDTPKISVATSLDPGSRSGRLL